MYFQIENPRQYDPDKPSVLPRESSVPSPVGPGWLNRRGRWEAPYELLAKSYDDGMKYYGKLKTEGKLNDMTMSEFADYYRKSHVDYKKGECALWKDILYGSNKEYFWYADPAMNVEVCYQVRREFKYHE